LTGTKVKDSNLLGSCAVLTDSYRRFEEAQPHLQSSGCCTVKMKVIRFSEISVTDYQLAHGKVSKVFTLHHHRWDNIKHCKSMLQLWRSCGRASW